MDRIENLRTYMRTHGWDAVVLTGSDPHGSEYPSERYKQICQLSGFSGEAAQMVVTADHAGVWTDSRYFIQAATQLNEGIELHKTGVSGEVPIPRWLAEHFRGESEVNIIIDGICTGTAFVVKELSEAFLDANIALTVIDVPDFIGALWKDRPELPQTPIFTAKSGESRISRIERVRKAFNDRGCGGILINRLDDIAWTLNVRGSDVEYNPLVISYLYIDNDIIRWFVSKGDAEDDETPSTFKLLESEGIDILSYDDIELEFSQGEKEGIRIMAELSSLNYHIYKRILFSGAEILDAPSPISDFKAVKNAFEIDNMKKAHVLDGVAMEKFIFWLEKKIPQGVNEWEAAVKLSSLRSEIPGYRSDSFATISAWGPDGALPHYITPCENAPMIRPEGLFLCDSGAQYDFGTTDITRTIPAGECGELEKEDYTLVLKGHIDLEMAVFPEGTPGCRLDAIAREPLWKTGRNYGHGTGHGIGYFLCVHEGPQNFRQNLNPAELKPGMITSDEPGIYREGKWGIRHENLILVVEKGENEFGKWYGFETLTLCHFDTSIIKKELLSPEEIEWLNSYNERVYRELCGFLSPEEAVWLRNKTQRI